MRLKFMAMLMTMFAASGLIGISAYGYVQKDSAYPTAPCTDSQGATTGFFCQPLSTKGKLVAACDAKKPKDLTSCQLGGANSYCVARGYSRSVSYNMDAKGNLSELVCSRAPVMSVAAAAPAPVEEWQPMFNVDLRGYDHREVPVANAQDWKACKAACDADGQCKAWTLVPERKICFLKWENNTELLSANSCCVTGIKGMASAGAEAKQSKVKTPAELKRLGSRTQQAAEDEVGRKAEDAVRRGIDKIL